MKNILILTALSFASFFAKAQTEVKAEDIGKHIGDSVHVCGKVFSARYFENGKNAPTLLNVGAAYPNQLFTVVIYSDVRTQFATAPETGFKDQTICINGKVEMFRDKPQIIIHDAKQISISKY